MIIFHKKKLNADGMIDQRRPDTRNWQGRQRELELLHSQLAAGKQLVGVKAARGFGKSALVDKLVEKLDADGQLEKFEATIWTTFTQTYSFAVWGRWLLEKLEKPAPEKEEELLIALANTLQGGRYLLILDNLESLLLSDGQWQDKGYHEFLLRWFASGSKSVILVTSREQPDLPRNTSHFWYSLDGLDEAAGIALLRGEEIPGSDEELKEFVHKANGHPLLLKLAAGLLRDEQEEIGSLTSPPTSLQNREGRTSPIFSMREGKFAGVSSLFDILGLHRDDPEASIAKILDASLHSLAPERRTRLFYLSVYRLPFEWDASLGNGEEGQGKIIEKEL